MVVTCNDADVCTYLENILGFRQTGDADIHADTKEVATLAQSSTIGFQALSNDVHGVYNQTVLIDDDVALVSSNLGDLNTYLQNILGIRQSGQNDIHADSQAAAQVVQNGTSGNVAIKNLLNTVNTNTADTHTKLGGDTGNQSTISDYLVNVLGLRQSGETDIHADTLEVKKILEDSSYGVTRLGGMLAAMGYPDFLISNPAQQIDALRDDLVRYGILTQFLQHRAGGIPGTLGDLLLNIAQYFLDDGGNQQAVTVQQSLTSLNIAPAFDQLTLGSPIAINPAEIYYRPDGAYGVFAALDVPTSWGLVGQNPNTYVPAVARITYLSTLGPLNNPFDITVEFPVAYPLQSGTNAITIQLGAGVSGTFQWLLLPH